MEEGSGLRRALRARLLLAHDATASTCDSLLDVIEEALGHVDISESSSVDDARLALRSSYLPQVPGDPRGRTRFALAFICLDLPPAPLGGVRLAQEALELGLPVVLITRSLRWIPASAAALRALPWVTPDATPAEVERAVGEALATLNASPESEGPRSAHGSPGRLAKGEPAPALRQAGGE